MTVPNTENNYVFTEQKSVSVGDPTEAEDDFNELAENTDHLRESKAWGWRGNCYADEDRRSEKTGTGAVYAANCADLNADIVLQDTSAVPVPQDFRYRSVWISGTVAIAAGDPEEHLPRGDCDEYLQGDETSGSPPSHKLFRIEALDLYAGPGQESYDDNEYCREILWDENTNTTAAAWRWYGCEPLASGNSVTIYLWVRHENAGGGAGDLMLRVQESGTAYDGWKAVYHLRIEYGPAWKALG